MGTIIVISRVNSLDHVQTGIIQGDRNSSPVQPTFRQTNLLSNKICNHECLRDSSLNQNETKHIRYSFVSFNRCRRATRAYTDIVLWIFVRQKVRVHTNLEGRRKAS